MLVNSKKIATWLEKQFPLHLAEPWDNVGFLIGNPDKVVKRILLALEVTPAVVAEAIDKNVDLIVCHHPLIFNPLNRLVDTDPLQRMIRQLVFHDIHVYAAHTNADIAENGLSDMFLDKLGLAAAEGLLEVPGEGGPHYLGRIAVLETAMTLKTCSEWIKKVLKAPKIRYAGDGKTKIKRIAVLTGSGDEAMAAAKAKHCDVLITGDLKHHPTQDALLMGLPLIDVGHYQSEIIFKSALKARMVEAFEAMDYDVAIEVSTSETEPFEWV